MFFFALFLLAHVFLLPFRLYALYGFIYYFYYYFIIIFIYYFYLMLKVSLLPHAESISHSKIKFVYPRAVM